MEMTEEERRVFAWDPLSFRVDRNSPAGSELRLAVSEKLLHFLGTYSDQVLVEYIIVLVGNGKNQYQAKEDLEAFLGDNSGRFVAWLWEYLRREESPCEFSKSSDSSSTIPRLPELLTDVVSPPSDDQLSDEGSPAHHFGAMDERHVSSSFTLSSVAVNGGAPRNKVKSRSLEQLIEPVGPCSDNLLHADRSPAQCFGATNERHLSVSSHRLSSQVGNCGDQNRKRDQSISFRSFCGPKSEVVVASRSVPSTSRSEINARKRAPLLAVNSELTKLGRRSGDVWDRLGKPINEVNPAKSGRINMPNLHREQPITATEITCNGFQGQFRKITKVCDSPSYKRKREESRIIFRPDGRVSVKHRLRGLTLTGSTLGFDFLLGNNLNASVGEGERQLAGGQPSVKNPLQDLTLTRSTLGFDFVPSSLVTPTSNMNDLLGEGVRQPVVQPLVKNQLHGELTLTGSRLGVDSDRPIKLSDSVGEKVGGQTLVRPESAINKRTRNEVSDVKSKMGQVNIAKVNPQPGAQNQQEEDMESRTVLVTNVHFGATKEAVRAHFTKCGPVSKVVMLSDAVTAQPKGAAYVVFTSKESVEKALLMSGTSFCSRILTVMRKSETPPGFLLPHQQVRKQHSLQSMYSQAPLQYYYPQRSISSSSHLQWRRNRSINTTNMTLRK